MCIYAIYEEAVIAMIAPNPYIISHGNIMFDLCLFDLCSFSQRYNYGIGQGLPGKLSIT
jgi:hypothetical protein